MAIISGSLALLGTGAKALASGMAKKATTSAAKKFVTGSGKKKKGDGGIVPGGGESGGRGGALVKAGISGVTPYTPMVASSTDSESSEVKVQPVGKVSFESLTKQLNSITSLTSQLQSQSSAELKGKEKALSNARVATAKAKSREKEERNENKSGALSFLGDKAKQAGEGLGIFNFLKNILLGIGALSLIDNATKIIDGLKFLGENLHKVWLGIKGIGLLFKSVGKNLPKAFKALKTSLGKLVRPVTNKFKALKTGIKAVFGKLGQLIPGFVRQGFNKLIEASRAVSQGISSTAEAFGRAATFNTKGTSLGKTSSGLNKLLGSAGTGGAGAASSLGISDGFRRLPGSSGRTNIYTLSKKARDVRAKHGNAAAEMYQQAINSGKTSKRAMFNVRKAIDSKLIQSTPMKGSLGGGIGGSKLLKKGFKVSGKRVLIKFMGKGGAKVALKALSNIPVIGPLIVAVTSLLSGEPVAQSLFKAGGALLGGMLGSFIPIPVVGTILGELVGEYVGDLFYTLIMGGGVEALGQKLKKDITSALSAGAKAMDWVKDGFGRFYKGIPKIEFGLGAFKVTAPNPAFFLNPLNVKKQLDLFWKAFFTDKPMTKGEEEKRTAESEAKRKLQEQQQAALRLQDVDTSDMDPSVAQWIERQKQLDIDSGLVPDPNGDFVLKGPDGKPLVVGQSPQQSSSITEKVPLANLQDIGVGSGAVGKSSERGMRNGKHHAGIDIGTSGQKGWYVAFKLKGKVSDVGTFAGYGKTVVLTCGDKDFLFAHLAEIMVRKGEDYVGQIIGEIGNTGIGSGEHLHFEVSPAGTGGYGSDEDPNPYIKYLEIGRKGASDPTKQTPQVDLKPPTPAEVTPTETAVPGTNKPVTVPMDQIPGENASQAEKDEYFRRLEAGELTGRQPSSNIPPPAPVLPPPPGAQVSPTTPPVSQSSPVESQAPYEQNGGGSVVMMAPPAPAQSGGGGGGRGKGGMVMTGSGDVLNSYYRAQLLGFLYKFG